ncbi:MAG: hypothetical protein NT007_17660 [Candidatus Kapabacteria bacterium]|nr:hypothetical protein [Candidatus Kapabacteria bacterium]
MNRFLAFFLLGFTLLVISCNSITNALSNPSIDGTWISTNTVTIATETITLNLKSVTGVTTIGGTGTIRILVPGLSDTTYSIPAITGTYSYPNVSLTIPGAGAVGGGSFIGTMASDGKTFSGTLKTTGAPDLASTFTKK